MKVPQFIPWIGKQEYQALENCFKSTWITEGPLSEQFKLRLLKIIGSKYGVFAPNGTLALFLGLKALGIKEGNEVIVPDFTFIASATSVQLCGATPVFVDVNRKNFQIDVRLLDKSVTPKTKAIMPVHIYGTVANMTEVNKFAKRHNLMVIEDAAQAIGVHLKGKHAGTFGDIGCFSFFADKTITTAEGGFVVTNKIRLYKKLLHLRNHGRIKSGSFIHPKIGYNLRITDLHAAIGLTQLIKLPQIKKRKLEILTIYKKLLRDIPEVTFFSPESKAEWLPFRVAILTKSAYKLMKFLESKGIQPRSFFYPLHRQPAFNYLKRNQLLQDKQFPNAVYGYKHGVCLPTFPTITTKQIKYVASTIKSFYIK